MLLILLMVILGLSSKNWVLPNLHCCHSFMIFLIYRDTCMSYLVFTALSGIEWHQKQPDCSKLHLLSHIEISILPKLKHYNTASLSIAPVLSFVTYCNKFGLSTYTLFSEILVNHWTKALSTDTLLLFTKNLTFTLPLMIPDHIQPTSFPQALYYIYYI